MTHGQPLSSPADLSVTQFPFLSHTHTHTHTDIHTFTRKHTHAHMHTHTHTHTHTRKHKKMQWYMGKNGLDQSKIGARGGIWLHDKRLCLNCNVMTRQTIC